MSQLQILTISFCIVAIFVLLFVLLFKSPESKTYYMSATSDLDPNLKKMLRVFGPDVLGLIPKERIKKASKDEELELLLRRAGNPWNLTPSEFYLLKCVLLTIGALVGLLLGAFVSFALSPLIGVPMGVFLPILGWLYPNSTYEKIANKRDMEFKKKLPEAIDLLIMALSGGNFTLINGIEEIIPHMEESPIKDEFKTIIRDTESGMSVSEALENFAERVPTDGIKSFVRSLINANRLSVDMTTILEARAVESRKELRDEAEKRIAALPNKVMGVLSPASAISIMIIAIAPFAYLLMQFF